MSETRDDLNEERVAEPARRSGLPENVKRAGIYLGAALVIFLLGLVPMWLKASANARERDEARRELQVSRMQNALASAAVDAQRGEYEPARQAASDFFTALREQVDGLAGAEPALTPAQRDAMRPLHAQRDEIITLLARSDPAASPRLLDMHAAFRKAVPGTTPEAKR